MVKLDKDGRLGFVVVDGYILAEELGARMGSKRKMEPREWTDVVSLQQPGSDANHSHVCLGDFAPVDYEQFP